MGASNSCRMFLRFDFWFDCDFSGVGVVFRKVCNNVFPVVFRWILV